MGVTPSAFAFSAESTTIAAAPSVMPDEFPAVTVPVFGLKTGGELRQPGQVGVGPRVLVLRELHLALACPAPSPRRSPRANRPSSHARAALCWLRRAKASCSSRGMRYCSARVSAVSPMSCPLSGHRKPSWYIPSTASWWPMR